MFGLPLMFTVPAALGALVALPALYYLLRVTPPRPRQIPFPPLRLILDAKPKQEKPARTPLWLLILRLSIAALIILAMAGPIWNPPAATLGGKGPVLVLLDDGFAAAPSWEARVAAAADRLNEAEHGGRTAAVAPLSEGAREILPMLPARALERLRALKPVPILPDRLAALPAATAFVKAHPDADVVWIADGLENGGARAFAQRLIALGGRPPHVVAAAATPIALAGSENRPDKLTLRVIRADGQAAAQGLLRATDLKGLTLGEAPFDFGHPAAGTAAAPGGTGAPNSNTETTASFDLPVELRNDIARVAVEGEASAGAVALLDGRWKRRRVEIMSGATADVSQPLLSPSYFLIKALAPFADIREVRSGSDDPVIAGLDENPSVMILADVGAVTGPAHERLERFIDNGGMLLRFAGSRLASASDDLEPVSLRRGGRTFGGALSWDKPKPLAPFDSSSPFFGLAIPSDVTVTRQVLAEPDAGLPGKTWAQLVDGTPLVTAQKRGKGFIVLFHVTADTTWSNLPLSGLFVDMLRRIVDLSGASGTGGANTRTAPDTGAALAPARILDGFGTLGEPPLQAKPIPPGFAGAASAEHPPGFYGPSDAFVAVNTLPPDARLVPADWQGLSMVPQPLKAAEPTDLRSALITLGLLAFFADMLATLWLGGGLTPPQWRLAPRRRRAAGAGTALALAGLLALGAIGASGLALVAAGGPAHAEEAVSKRDMDAALSTRLAYVETGDAAVDEASRQGLKTLSHALASRTSLDPGEPVAIDPAHDELAFYPLLYWPVVASMPQPAAETAGRIAAFMKNGGTVIFDTRDALTTLPGDPPSPEGRWLQQFLGGIDVPELEPVPRDHVVTKTFYLIDGFVGRYSTGQTWIEALPPAPPDQVNRPARSGDSVSPIVITSNDLAAGWAADSEGDPLYPLVPGGNRQREFALRGGINLVMYTLTGNYKADQVHVRDLLERLAH